jgi:hypothetical protein
MKNIYILLLIGLLWSCERIPVSDELTFPLFDEPTITNIDPSGVTVETFIHQIGDESIIRCAFNWFPADKTHFIEAERFMIDITPKDQETARVRIDRDLMPDQTYAARLIIETTSRKVYSDTVHFISQGATHQPLELIKGSGINGSQCMWALGHLMLAGGFQFNATLVTYRYDPVAQEWGDIPTSFSRNLIRGYIQSDDQNMYSIGRQSIFPGGIEGLWKMSQYNAGFDYLSAFPVNNNEFLKFSFLINGQCYSNSPEGDFVRYDLENFDGFIPEPELPFALDALAYHSTVIERKGYVLFSPPAPLSNDVFHEHEFWEYDTQTKVWRQLPDFPGTGRDYFTLTTDSQRYIYVGMGTIGQTNADPDLRILEGDIWQYDTQDESWSLVGWGPKNGQHIPYYHGRVDNGKQFFPYLEGSIRLLEFDQSQLQPL